MTPSENCLEFIKKEEGCVLHSYQDQAGIWTIGIGSTLHINGTRVGPGETISLQQAMSLLRFEVNNKAITLSSATQSAKLTQNQYDALVSFTYNVGAGALLSSTLLKKVKANAADLSIRDEFAKWNKIHVDGKLVPNAGLTARRNREADLYFT